MYFYMRTKSINVANSWGKNLPTHNDYNIHIYIVCEDANLNKFRIKTKDR